MIPFELVDSAPMPGSNDVLRLYRRGSDFSIRLGTCELMNSRMHASEEALAEQGCASIADRPQPRVLVGGLGMGYTAAAALRRLGAKCQVVVAELVPAVVQWNRGPLADLAGRPLDDARVKVREVDVARILRSEPDAYDAILLDVDNGPEALTRQGNNWLYAQAGLAATFAALRPGGVLAIWATDPDRAFVRRLRRAGFTVEERSERARGGGRGGGHYVIWLATRGK
ncbi:MAG: hypothetical protein A3K19_03530 [Lentisphaerae bacterium RIFOXYB12_FULL_65_16]|nr:MAG: hypothetical protein A3K18_30180 [Lentisphaerae bacterium RIFOXYA12_64_32]OGV86585.1 MAG: hypothetical protein A3K19_03530 [Lentisphaerae bacterium RIFOXYB12_FULL_65_16]